MNKQSGMIQKKRAYVRNENDSFFACNGIIRIGRQRVKKYCVLLICINVLCALVLTFQAYAGTQKGIWDTASDGTLSSSDSEYAEGGSSQDEVYLLNENEKRRVAITFDDGPNATWTPKLLEGLKERGVKACFFVIGQKAEANPQLIRQMYEEGHVIGNHTYSHVQLTRLSKETVYEEITKTNQIIQEITGESPLYIRPPFGSWDEEFESSLSMIPVMWTVDTLDWKSKNTDSVVRRALKGAKDNSIILLHDNYETSVEGALCIIDELQKEGFEFVTVEELLLE